MKKNSKVIRKDYSKYDNWDGECYLDGYKIPDNYGFFIKKGRVHIDVKRYAKYFKLPEGVNKPRNTVYFIPTKVNYKDYNVNAFLDALDTAKKTWYEQKNMIHKMFRQYVDMELKKPVPNYDYDYYCGILESDEWQMSNNMAKILHQERIRNEIDCKGYNLMITLWSQSIHMIASHMEHAMVETMTRNGWQGDKAGRRDIYNFVGTKLALKKNENAEEKIRKLPHFEIWDKFYAIWNFCKHNSQSTYDKIYKHWPELLYRKGVDEGFTHEFPSDLMAIEYLKLSDKFFNGLFEPLSQFYMEFCNLVYGEAIGESRWNYDQYFIDEVEQKIKDETENIENPLGLPWWL